MLYDSLNDYTHTQRDTHKKIIKIWINYLNSKVIFKNSEGSKRRANATKHSTMANSNDNNNNKIVIII